MNTNGACEECQKESCPSSSTPIGESVQHSISVVRGYANSNHSFYQCKTCGSIWMIITDSGAGGQGRFHHRLTKGYF